MDEHIIYVGLDMHRPKSTYQTGASTAYRRAWDNGISLLRATGEVVTTPSPWSETEALDKETKTMASGRFSERANLKVGDTTPIFVTRPSLPPLEEFLPYLEKIWASKWLTNCGPFHQQLENELAAFLGVDRLALVSNGTLGLVIAMQALHITGEVITTPYSFVATAHSLLWNNLKPVFVDIDPRTCNLDPSKIEAAITPLTTAILPVHCYGTPCDVDGIQLIADVYGLKVIYDAAHAFDVRIKGESVLNHGDLSVLSFHATKVFNTFEGGAIICPDAKTKQRIDYLKNFGFSDEITVTAPGINGKLNEFQSALGLLQLRHVHADIEARKKITQTYLRKLHNVAGITCFASQAGVTPNYSYFPILVGSCYPLSRDGLYEKLRENGIFSRRYFYPLISTMPMYRGLPSSAPSNLPVATSIAEQVLCLPIYPDLSGNDVEAVITAISNRE
jgi:dTDP-4-amino-4,6-dideoxygalactose transaminase